MALRGLNNRELLSTSGDYTSRRSCHRLRRPSTGISRYSHLRRWCSGSPSPPQKLRSGSSLPLAAANESPLAMLQQPLNNDYVKAMNSLTQPATSQARGYGSIRHYIANCYLLASKLKRLPESPLWTCTAHGCYCFFRRQMDPA